MRLLDLYCCGGGAAVGYHRAGFEVVGVDIADHSATYPFEFIQGDALDYLDRLDTLSFDGALEVFDAIHASPPCQKFTHAKYLGSRGRADHENLIPETRLLLEATGLPYVIENVDDARAELHHPVLLCGSMFGRPIRRHRLFETNWPLMAPRCQHGVEGERRFPSTPREDGSRPLSRVVNMMASDTTHEMLAEAMGIDWMPAPGRKRPTPELCEAVPPDYTEYIGAQLASHVAGSVAA